RELKGTSGRAAVHGSSRPELRRVVADGPLEPKLLGVEQSNTSVSFGDEVLVKLIRRLEPGVNPELEVGSALTDAGFEAIADVLGGLEYGTGSKRMTVAVAQRFGPTEGDAWSLTVDCLDRFREEPRTGPAQPGDLPVAPDPFAVDQIDVPDEVMTLIGPMVEPIDRLAERTGELHLTLAEVTDEAFAPEPFSTLYQRSLYQSFRGQTRSTLAAVRRALRSRPSYAEETIVELERLVE